MFSGSGTVGFEAASRGASLVAAVDASPQASRIWNENWQQLGALGKYGYIMCHFNKQALIAAS